MRPGFARMRSGYPKSEKREVLFRDLGWDDIVDKPAYKDTCAIRMSVALIQAGVSLTSGSMRALAGKLKGSRIEPRQHRLSEILRHKWGEPEKFGTEKAAKEGIGHRSGVVSFFRIAGGPGGHIDLVYPGPYGFSECARSCYFEAWETWFWALD